MLQCLLVALTIIMIRVVFDTVVELYWIATYDSTYVFDCPRSSHIRDKTQTSASNNLLALPVIESSDRDFIHPLALLSAMDLIRKLRTVRSHLFEKHRHSPPKSKKKALARCNKMRRTKAGWRDTDRRQQQISPNGIVAVTFLKPMSLLRHDSCRHRTVSRFYDKTREQLISVLQPSGYRLPPKAHQQRETNDLFSPASRE
jgi:hypothetical protein